MLLSNYLLECVKKSVREGDKNVSVGQVEKGWQEKRTVGPLAP